MFGHCFLPSIGYLDLGEDEVFLHLGRCLTQGGWGLVTPGSRPRTDPKSHNIKTRQCTFLSGGIFTIGSMYGIFTYIWLIFMVNVGKYIYHTWILWVYHHLLQLVHLDVHR